jgi:rubrerythrin
MIRYNADELFQMALAVERHGEAFYRSAAENVDDEELSTLLTTLAEWEVRHEKRFAEIRSKLPARATRDHTPGDPEEEHAGDYLAAFADGKVFPAKADIDFASADVLQLLDYALGREKDTIVFFLTMIQHVPEHWGHDQVRAIVDEELKHVHILTRERAKRLVHTDSPESHRLGSN